jgi:hypothetical protein
LEIPGIDGTIRESIGSRAASLRSVVTDGLTSTSPATSARCCSASRSASVPPIDRPNTNTDAQRWVSSRNASSTAWYHSGQPVRFMSCHTVPCPGSSGQRVVQPSAASRVPHGAMLCGEPVKPWHSNTPMSVDPSWPNGSAPGRMGTVTVPGVVR